jgi:hypothetical protein
VIQRDLPILDSFLILCPWCGDCWAKLRGTDTTHWWHRYVPCLDHPQAAFVYGCWLEGSLLELDLSLRLFDVLPEDLLRREFDLTMSKLDLTQELTFE